MAKEIERKFLLKNDSWKTEVSKTIPIQQGYLNSSIDRNVRVRVKKDKAILTVKSKSVSLTRQEFEYEIPHSEGLQLIDLCEKPIIKKTRYIVKRDRHVWEIDIFEGENEGLAVAEIELSSEDEAFDLPEWIGKEVSDDTRYFNSSLIIHPYSKWETK